MASSSDSSGCSTLFAAIDMGTNSFKMIIIRAYPNGKFITIDRFREPVVLGRDTTHTSSSSSTTPFTLSAQSQLIAVEALKKFQNILTSYRISKAQVRCVATAAVREAVNRGEFLKCVGDKIGLDIDVLPGEEEARLVYLGMLKFWPVYENLVLGVDIGGGSTEFVIGKQGTVVFGASLKLGHVSLTQKFGNNVDQIREHIRLVVKESGLVRKIKDCGFEVVVGSSGTIKAVEKAVFSGYVNNSNVLEGSKVGAFGDGRKDWRLSRGEVKGVVESLCCGGEGEKKRRETFFERRSEFIVAGAVLLEEIFEVLGIEGMEVSGYALAEGVIAESLAKVDGGYDLKANARWSSVVRLAMRYNGKKRMSAAALCAITAKEIFEGLRKCDDLADNRFAASLDDKYLEYLEAASLLHNIGVFIGKKGYHKHSYCIIMNGKHLHGYSSEEVKLIGLLARHHRKELPSFDHASFKKFPGEMTKKFRFLCTILRVSVALQQLEFSNSYEDFKLVNCGAKDQTSSHIFNPLAKDIEDELRQELEYFKLVFFKELLIVAPSSVPDPRD